MHNLSLVNFRSAIFILDIIIAVSEICQNILSLMYLQNFKHEMHDWISKWASVHYLQITGTIHGCKKSVLKKFNNISLFLIE